MQTTPSTSRVSGAKRTTRHLLAAAGLLLAVPTALLVSSAPAAAATTQTASCTDGGGVRWNTRAIWGGSYTAADGVRRVAMDHAGWTTSRAGTVPTDSWVRTYDGSGTFLRSLAWSGSFAYQSGSTYKVQNPLNPPSAPGKTKVTITLGVDGDGYGNCTVTFTQPGGTTPTPSPSPSPGTASDTYEADVIKATNAERTSRSLAALTHQDCVDSYAEAQSARMAAEDRMFHQEMSPILRACNLSAVGENVAYGYSSGAAVTDGWMNSSGHRANILNPRYRLIGVGATQSASGRWYAAQVFGAN
ncbi:MAG TPA: CAP domain-containing protein [Propionibacteriaceae bacterium]|nr:CAP domain-containing protein [Propionibacteriaceae bacterium]